MAKKNKNIVFNKETIAIMKKIQLETRKSACEYCYKCMVDEFSCGNYDEDDDCIYCGKVFYLLVENKRNKQEIKEYKQDIKRLEEFIKELRGFE